MYSRKELMPDALDVIPEQPKDIDEINARKQARHHFSVDSHKLHRDWDERMKAEREQFLQESAAAEREIDMPHGHNPIDLTKSSADTPQTAARLVDGIMKREKPLWMR